MKTVNYSFLVYRQLTAVFSDVSQQYICNEICNILCLLRSEQDWFPNKIALYKNLLNEMGYKASIKT